MEKWRTIEGFPNYEVSDHGRIRRTANERELVQSVNQYGVVCIGLVRDGKQYHRSVPRLVAKAFVPHPLGPFDTPINLDGNRENNHVDNLMWRPRWFAVMYNKQFREPYEHPINETIEDIKDGTQYDSSWDCALANGLLEKDVVLAILNRTYTWPTYQEFRIAEK